MKARRRADRKTIGRNPRGKILELGLLLLAALVFSARGATVVVNEIYFHPAEKQPLEFIELYNAASETITVTGWSLNKFIFPSNTVIKAGGFLVVAAQPTAFEKEFGFKPLGPLET